MPKILIAFPLHDSTVDKLGLKPDTPVRIQGVDILYAPSIGLRQHYNLEADASLGRLGDFLEQFTPDVLVLGNNAVSEDCLERWRSALTKKGVNEKPLIIRRGIEIGGIPIKKAEQLHIEVKNIPGINSPYVAQHMVTHLDLDHARPNEKVAVLGMGNIGLPIVRAALAIGLHVSIYSPSLANADGQRRKTQEMVEYMNKSGIRLREKNIEYCGSLRQAMEGAKRVAISVPWWLPDKQAYNRDFIDVQNVAELAKDAIVVSCSNPRIFSIAALKSLNASIADGSIAKVRIDTGQRYAREVHEHFDCEHIDAHAGEAFYIKPCLLRLDKKVFEIAMTHFKKPHVLLTSKIENPEDDKDIQPHVVDDEHFFGPGRRPA